MLPLLHPPNLPHQEANQKSDVGAVTWANDNAGLSGVVSVANSLVGSNAEDQIGNDGVVALSNGHYVIARASWSNGAQQCPWWCGRGGRYTGLRLR
ncbi:hypothetical protein [Dokdonella sp.]|uniref:hypothetical protein n=1 Tax=Dokdonella sp. TaxID=2291710 RepID=UPI0039C85F70